MPTERSCRDIAKECAGNCLCGFVEGFSWDGSHSEDCSIKKVADAIQKERDRAEKAERELVKVREIVITKKGLEDKTSSSTTVMAVKLSVKNLMDDLKSLKKEYKHLDKLSSKYSQQISLMADGMSYDESMKVTGQI